MAIFVPKVFCYKFRSFRREFGDFHRRIQDQEENWSWEAVRDSLHDVFFFFDGVEVRGEWLLGLCNPIISILNKSNSTSPPRSESDKNDKVLGKFKFFFKKQVIETFKIATIIFKH
jgi:hypothetical protein